MNIEDFQNMNWRDIAKTMEADAPKNVSWLETSSWLRKTYSQELLVEVCLCLYSKLKDMDLESEEADDFRDCLDPYWLACERELLDKKIHELLNKEEVKML